MIRINSSEQIYTLTDYGARAAVGIVDRKSPWPQNFNEDEKQALRRLQKEKYVNARTAHSQAFETLLAKMSSFGSRSMIATRQRSNVG